MNQWLLLRRLRGPAFLLLVGITALLNQWDVLGYSRSWPLYLILFGILSLAERGALARASLEGYDPLTGQPRSPVAGTYPGTHAPPGATIVPAPSSTTPGTDPGTGGL